MGSRSNSAANASDTTQDIKGVNLGARRKQPLQNDQGRTTLGAIPSNVDRGPTAARIHDVNLFGAAVDPHAAMSGLTREFTFPPFSVLNTRDGNWQSRKRAWLRLGIQSELGRGEHGGAEGGGKKTRAFDMGMKATAENDWAVEDGKGSGVSIFDPVVCELAYRWFCPPGGQIIDPFAGGSVRGVVASVLGRRYFGCDLSGPQVAANRVQAAAICAGLHHQPEWFAGDSVRIKRHVPDGFIADMWMSCPPYADLEVYSTHEADISNMAYPAFRDAYGTIIRRSCGLLRDNAFAVVVVGEVRDTKTPGSPYYGFVQDTIAAFRDAGLAYYNEIILVTAIGSLPLRTRRAFHSARKVGKTHQNILVFVKGDPKLAAAANPLKAVD